MQAHQWTCANCGNSYKLGEIEGQLVRAVRLRARAYQLQDLRCLKCRQVRAYSLMRTLPACDPCSFPLPRRARLAACQTRLAIHLLTRGECLAPKIHLIRSPNEHGHWA
jgi:DNA polymerase epsilon subunit 1